MVIMKKTLIALVVVAALVVWQWPAIAGWWQARQDERAAAGIQGDDLTPELDAAQQELDAAGQAAQQELDAIQNSQ